MITLPSRSLRMIVASVATVAISLITMAAAPHATATEARRVWAADIEGTLPVSLWGHGTPDNAWWTEFQPRFMPYGGGKVSLRINKTWLNDCNKGFAFADIRLRHTNGQIFVPIRLEKNASTTWTRVPRGDFFLEAIGHYDGVNIPCRQELSFSGTISWGK